MTDTGTTAPDPAVAAAEAKTAQMVEQVTKLTERLAALEESARKRPASSLEQTKAQLAELMGLKDEAVDQRKEGRVVADRVDAQVAELTRQLRASEIRTAAAEARFADPTLVVDMLAAKDGDPAALVADLAKRAPGLIASGRAPSADVGTGDAPSTGTGETKKGFDALVAEIAAAQQGTPYK